MTEYASFRQRLDAVLRTLDVQQVSKFLIAENQWDAGVPANAEFAMWMMIAGSSTLGDLHETARTWLMSHGYENEARAVLDRDKGGQAAQKGAGNKQRPRGGKPQKQGSGGNSAGGSSQTQRRSNVGQHERGPRNDRSR